MKRFLILVLALVALAACSEPAVRDIYSPGRGVHDFAVELTDTTALYDFEIYTPALRSDYDKPLRLEISWEGPSSEVFRETVYYPGLKRHGSREKYRTGVCISNPGTWKISIVPYNAPQDLSGLGLLVTRRSCE